MNKVSKVPVVMQQEAVECGAASLTMILAFYRKWLPLEVIRSDCGVSRDGSSAKNIVLVARKYGLSAQGFRYEPEELRDVKMPCVIHWNFNHFVVLCGMTRGYAVINDPARGCVKVPLQEFDKSFTGIVIVFAPTKDFVPGGRPPSVWEFAKERLHGTVPAFVFIISTSLLASILGVMAPVFARVFMDNLLTNKNPEWFMPFIYLFAGLIIIQTILTALQSNINLKITGKFAIISNGTFMWQVLRLPVDFFASRFAGDISARQSSNEGISAALIGRLAPLLINVVMVVFYLVVMLEYSAILTLLGISSAFFNIAITSLISKKRLNISRMQMRDSGKLAADTISGIEMIETIKSAGAEAGFFEKWAGHHASVNTATVNGAKINGYLGNLPVLLTQISNIAVLGVGAYIIMHGDFTVGMLLAFQGFLGSFMTPVNAILGVRQEITEMRTTMERVQDVMNYEQDVCYDGNDAKDKEYTKLSGKVELRNITFGYNQLSKPLLENFSLSLKTGSKVAIVGGSGCGKSTVAKLAAGLYKPWSGDILFDDKRMEEIPREVFTSSVAVVDQDITLFEDSINANIKMWDNTIEDFEVILAARDAQIHQMILNREEGYNHQIAEGGKNFSGGERQRIEIARALSADPTIAILDEATSALDAKTEYELINAIKNRGITCIIIAHRLSTIRDCDEIIVLDRGTVVERGTHDELYAKNGKYKDLVSMN